MKNTGLIWRIVLILSLITLMILVTVWMVSSDSGLIDDGKVDLSSVDFQQSVALNGEWEFYWNQLLTPNDFRAVQPPIMDSLMKVPGTWGDGGAGTKVYPPHGVATYRLRLNYPSTLKDPALSIQNIASAYKLYANGRLIVEVGKVSDKLSDFKEGEKSHILDLPNDTQELELVFQVANLNYARGGIRGIPSFGSKQILERQKLILLALQLFFIGSIFIFSIYYFLLFLLQKNNKTALLFSILCCITAVRSLIWGAAPLEVFFPDMSLDVRAYINYLTGYNLVPVMILFVLSIYTMEYKKTTLSLVLLPTLFFDALLLTPPSFISKFTNYLYLMILVQIIYILGVLIKAVLHQRDNAILMFIAIYVFVLAIIQDILHYKGLGGINISYMFLYGNFAVILAMSFVQAKQQANNHKRLILYNENLVEADRLKDIIIAKEMAFLQAQISSASQITSLQYDMEKLEWDSRTDPLTGLYNRRYIMKMIENEFISYRRNEKKFALIMADIDFFKEINDTYGHDCGDRVLKAISKSLQDAVREQDFVSRWGGEEFLILLPETEIEGAQILADRIRGMIEEQIIEYNGFQVSITMTFGVVVNEDDEIIEDIIKKADKALYEGKNRGKNCVILA